MESKRIYISIRRKKILEEAKEVLDIFIDGQNKTMNEIEIEKEFTINIEASI